jgi:HSF-type DNA-binding
MFMRDKPHLAHLIRQVSDSHYNHTHGPISYSALSSRLADSLAFKNTMASSMQATVTARLQGLRFPAKLHYLLCHGVYDLGFEGVMSWQPGGHSFAIQNTEDFEMQGLAEMLGTPGHASFRAQVFLHGFQRVRSDESDRVEVYYHPDFVREQPHLCRLIQIRNHLNTTVIRGTATACGRPNGTRQGVVSPPSTKSTKAVIELPKSIFVDYRSSSLAIGNPAGDYNPCNGRPAANDPGVNIISVTPKKRPRLGHAMTQNYFPFKLHSLLTLAEKFGCQNLLCWAPHGRCFVINDKDLFCESVLPLFRHSEFASFRAQLKAYGFQRTNQAGPDRGAYFHPCFLRGRAELCATITRRPKNLNGTIRGRPKGSQAYSEPEFYRMKFLPDLDVGAVIPPPGPIKDVLEAALTQITPPAPSIVAIAKINHRVDSPNGDIEGRESIKLRDDMEQTFPMKLHTLLSAQEHQVSNFVTWSDSGRSFNITDKMAFEASGCARLGLSSLAHFIEELVAFEFKRDEQTGAYYHEMFLKALPHLSRCIKRAVTFPKAGSCNSSIHEARAAVMATATRGNNLGDSCSSNSTAASESDPSELEVAAALAAMDDRSAQERAPATTTMVPVSPLTSDELSNASGSDLGAASSRRLSATVPMSVFSLACKLPSTILPFETVTVTSKRRQMSDPPGRYEMQQARSSNATVTLPWQRRNPVKMWPWNRRDKNRSLQRRKNWFWKLWTLPVRTMSQ